MKTNSKIVYILILCFVLIKCEVGSSHSNSNAINSESLPIKMKKYAEMGRNYYFNIFDKWEQYLINFHQYIQKDLNLEYPLDLIVFTLLGYLIHYILSFFSFKTNYVYNMADQPDLNTLLNNKFKELTSITKSVQVGKKPENSSEPESTANDSVSKINKKIESLNVEVDNLKKEIKYNFSEIDEYLKTIISSQSQISDLLNQPETETPGEPSTNTQ